MDVVGDLYKHYLCCVSSSDQLDYDLSEINTKRMLSGSLRAFPNNRLSASIMEILPHTTCPQGAVYIINFS